MTARGELKAMRKQFRQVEEIHRLHVERSRSPKDIRWWTRQLAAARYFLEQAEQAVARNRKSAGGV